MKKYLFTLFAIILLAGTSCQEKPASKQYFEDSPEIDLVKRAMDAYLKQDWETYRSCYSDTARIWQNIWYTSDPGLTIEEEIEATKIFVSSLYSYSYTDTIWEMIINNNGNKYIHFWGNWVGKLTADSDEIYVAVHIASEVVGDKIVIEVGLWDNLPMYLAQQSLKTNEK